MAFNPSSAAGTQLLMSASSPVSYTLIDGVQGLEGPTISNGQIEYTAISDTAKKFLADLPDYGTCSFDLAWDPSNSNHAALKAAVVAASTLYFKKLLDDAGAAYSEFQGFVASWSEKHQKGGFNMVSVSIKVSGADNLVP